MNSSKKNERVVRHKKSCRSSWWNQSYHFQESLHEKLESRAFRALVIFLVIFDTALLIGEIMLEYFKLYFTCERIDLDTVLLLERIHLAMEIGHYLSIGILGFFLLELFVKIFASGKYFWNIKKKKMEYFDAIVVIVSFILDVVTLSNGAHAVGERIFIIFSLRLWRFVRIVSSVAGGIRHGEAKRKRHLSNQYILALQRLIDLLEHKTDYYLDETRESNQNESSKIFEHFRSIDLHCRSSLEELSENRVLTSSVIVKHFIESLNGLETINTFNVVATLLGKATEV